MKRWCLSTAVTTAAAAALGLAGCQAKPKPMVPPEPPPAEMSAQDQRAAAAAASAAAFRSTLAKFDADLAGLPGHTEPDHRAAAAATLADLTGALRTAYGDNPPPGFTADVAILDGAARTVALSDVPRARMEAAETEALHAATAGLTEVATRVLFDDPALPPLIDAANAKVAVARASRGPLHDGDATDALTAIGVVLHQVDQDLQDRVPPKPMPTPEPAVPMPAMPMPPVPMPPVPMPPVTPTTEPTPAVTPVTPATEPTTLPTTMPATAPTTMP